MNAPSTPTPKSFKVEVHGVGDPKDHFVSNALRFKTREEADDYGDDLSCRWFGMDEYRVVESDEEPNR